jgi:adenylate cyclase
MKKGVILLITSIILALPYIYQPSWYDTLKLKTFDRLVKKQEPSGYFTILNITEQDVINEGGYPFPRQRLAEIQKKLYSKGAIGVGWVMAFTEPDRFGGDEEFAETVKMTIPTVFAMFENDTKFYPKTTGTVILGNDVAGFPARGVRQNVIAGHEGVASAPVDVDNLVRRMPLLMKSPDGWVPAYGTQVLKILAESDTYIIKTNANGIEEITVKGIPPVKTDSLGRKWISWVDTPETTLDEMDVENKFVFVGVTAQGVMPQVATPTGLLEPHKIQAALAESILIEDSPYIPDYSLAVEILIFLISVSVAWFYINYFGIFLSAFSLIFVLLTQLVIGAYLVHSGLLIDISWSFISTFIIGSVAFYLRFQEQYKLRQQIKKQFEHYLDPRQVKKLQQNPELLKLGGEKRNCTFIFTDLRGFTALSESVTPEQVTYIMNKVLTAQQKAVQKYEGMVDKYIGDAMMAIFNAPLDMIDHEKRAVECGVEIMKNISLLNQELQSENLPGIAIGIGINTGEAIVGNMGSEGRFDYTAIGDAVNTAARLESATKECGVNILIGETTESLCGYHLLELEPIMVKGKSKPLKIYTWK